MVRYLYRNTNTPRASNLPLLAQLYGMQKGKISDTWHVHLPYSSIVIAPFPTLIFGLISGSVRKPL